MAERPPVDPLREDMRAFVRNRISDAAGSDDVTASWNRSVAVTVKGWIDRLASPAAPRPEGLDDHERGDYELWPGEAD